MTIEITADHFSAARRAQADAARALASDAKRRAMEDLYEAQRDYEAHCKRSYPGMGSELGALHIQADLDVASAIATDIVALARKTAQRLNFLAVEHARVDEADQAIALADMVDAPARLFAVISAAVRAEVA